MLTLASEAIRCSNRVRMSKREEKTPTANASTVDDDDEEDEKRTASGMKSAGKPHPLGLLALLPKDQRKALFVLIPILTCTGLGSRGGDGGGRRRGRDESSRRVHRSAPLLSMHASSQPNLS